MKKRKIIIISVSVIAIIVCIKMYNLYMIGKVNLMEVGAAKYPEVTFDVITPDLIVGVESHLGLPDSDDEYGGKTFYIIYKYKGMKNTYDFTYDSEKFLIGEYSKDQYKIQDTTFSSPNETKRFDEDSFGYIRWRDGFALKSRVVIVEFELEEKYMEEEDTHNTFHLIINKDNTYDINAGKEAED